MLSIHKHNGSTGNGHHNNGTKQHDIITQNLDSDDGFSSNVYDPRIPDDSGNSELIAALLDGDIGKIREISEYCETHDMQPIPLSNDYNTIGSIDIAITAIEHDYSTADLLGLLKHMYTGVYDLFG